MDVAGHDANLGRARRDNARAIWPDQARVIRLERLLDPHHVIHRNTFRDADNELDARIRRFKNSVGSATRWNVDHGDIGTRGLHCLMRGVEYRQAEVLLATTARRDAAHQLRAIVETALTVESTLITGETLADNAAFLVQQNAHRDNVLCEGAGFRPQPKLT